MFVFTVVRIGFRQPAYNYLEPDVPTLIENVTIIKEDNTPSEQTYVVSISFGDPGPGLRPASLQETADQLVNFDYLVGDPGQRSISRLFNPGDSEIPISFTLFPDELPEGSEGFRATIESGGLMFNAPEFQLPALTGPIPNPRAFVNTLISITDNDCELIANGMNTHFQLYCVVGSQCHKKNS